MDMLSSAQLQSISQQRGISYEPIEDVDPLVVRTRMSRHFPMPRAQAFDLLSKPENHVPLFSIIKGTTPPIRSGIEQVLPDNQFFAFEHVEEGNLPARLMLILYSLEPPARIIKEPVTNPFENPGIDLQDKKRGRVSFSFDEIGPDFTNIIAESVFHSETGAVFARGFIDHVWLNFYERLMVSRGMIEHSEMLSGDGS
jgi:hypothetical protein